MRVIVVGRHHVDSFASEICDGLRGLGVQHRPFEVGPRMFENHGPVSRFAKRVTSVWRSITEKADLLRRGPRLLRTVLDFDADLVLVAHDWLLPAHVADLKRSSRAAVCLWYPDAVSNFGRAFFLNAPYDALFFKDPFVATGIREKLGKPSYYLPECALPQPAPEPDEPDASLACDVTIAGNLYSYRQAFFAQLANYDVRIWGNPPPFWMQMGAVGRMVQNRYLTGVALGRAYRSAKVVVNSLFVSEVWGVNARAFSVCAHGAFQMIDHRPALAQLFRDGEEVVTFGGIEDLRAKLDFYLQRAEDRARIALAGRARVLRDHTYERRLALLMDTVRGTGGGFPLPDSERP